MRNPKFCLKKNSSWLEQIHEIEYHILQLCASLRIEKLTCTANFVQNLYILWYIQYEYIFILNMLYSNTTKWSGETLLCLIKRFSIEFCQAVPLQTVISGSNDNVWWNQWYSNKIVLFRTAMDILNKQSVLSKGLKLKNDDNLLWR